MPTFPQCDWTKCSAFDVIDHSMRMHPSLFLERLERAARAHHDYSMRTYHADMREKCTRWAKESMRAHRRLKGGISAIVACDTFHNTIECFNVAASLQLVPTSVRDDIISRSAVGPQE